MKVVLLILVLSLGLVTTYVEAGSLQIGSDSQLYPLTTVTLYSEPALDGHVSNNGWIASGYYNIYVGDDVSNQGWRGFVSFDLSSIPAGATITAATLRIFQSGCDGTPYSDLGNVLVDHLNYGDTLDGTDYDLPAIHSNIGILSDSSGHQWRELDVTIYVQDDINNGRVRSQFRLYRPIMTDYDSALDGDVLYAGEYLNHWIPSFRKPPELVITLGPTWEYVFEDARRGTILRVSTDDMLFQFIAPDKDYGVKQAQKMVIRDIRRGGQYIRIYHTEDTDDNGRPDLRFYARMNTRIDRCLAVMRDFDERRIYVLLDRPGIE
jgi:hypothetical protein